MVGRGRLPGPLIPRFPAAPFRLMPPPPCKVTPPWMPETPAPPGSPSGQCETGPTTGWAFNPLDPATPACTAIQDELDRELKRFSAACSEPEPEPQPATNKPDDKPKWDNPQLVVQPAGYQFTHHWNFPHPNSYGTVFEHAFAAQVAINAPLHAKGESGLEFQVAAAFLYDCAYQNDKEQGQEAYLDHSVAHRPKNLQLSIQFSYLWPFFVKEVGEDKASILDLSLLGQLVGADNWAYDYVAHQTQMAKQLQFVVGGSVAIKPLAYFEPKWQASWPKLSGILRGISLTFGPQVGVTTLVDTNTVDFSFVVNVSIPVVDF